MMRSLLIQRVISCKSVAIALRIRPLAITFQLREHKRAIASPISACKVRSPLLFLPDILPTDFTSFLRYLGFRIFEDGMVAEAITDHLQPGFPITTTIGLP
jgi:hypothetical protein